MKNENGFVSFNQYKKMMQKNKLTFRQVEKQVFKCGLTPLRFKRNQSSISQKEQFKLFKSHVAIVGCGGLGGSVSENLARIGVGKLTLIDQDRFCEHNLNRQNFSSFENLHVKKVNVLKKELLQINPALHVKKHFTYLHVKNIDKLLRHADVVIDCVDDIKTKKLLSFWCEKYNKKFIHGAIGGKTSQISTSTKLNLIYKDEQKGAEKIYGNLSMVAQNCASFQALMCINFLLYENFSYKNLLYCDLENLEFIELPI